MFQIFNSSTSHWRRGRMMGHGAAVDLQLFTGEFVQSAVETQPSVGVTLPKKC